MSGIIAILSVVWGSYVAQPAWFDDGPYVEKNHYSSLEECQIDTHGTDDICVGGGIKFTSYVIDKTVKVKSDGKLNYVYLDCDAPFGCYIKE